MVGHEGKTYFSGKRGSFSLQEMISSGKGTQMGVNLLGAGGYISGFSTFPDLFDVALLIVSVPFFLNSYFYK